MAQWVNRPRVDGGTSIQIRWMILGKGGQSETFTDARLASEFRTAVEMAGHEWPEGWIKGEGWAVEEPAPPTPEPLTFADIALGKDPATGKEGYFETQQKRAKRGKITPYTGLLTDPWVVSGGHVVVVRPGSGGQRPPRVSSIMAMRAWALWNP